LKALRVALLASMVTTVTRIALAQSSEGPDRPVPPPSEPAKDRALAFRHRALLGIGGGYLFTSTQLNGESVAEQDGGSSSTGVFEFGLEERFTRLFSVAARARRFTTGTEWSYAVGYKRFRWDLGLEPRLWIRPKKSPGLRSGFIPRRVEGYAGVGSGVTLASEEPPPRRAYDERIEGHPGYCLSACIGGTLSGEHVAMFTELGYAFHSTHFDATLEPRAPGVPRTSRNETTSSTH
jgi:hypothetical protein